MEYTPFYWATEALKLKLGLKTPNFVGLELQQAPQRRTLMQVTGAVTVLAALACLLGSLWCYVQARVVRSRLAAQTTQIAQLQTRHKELQTLHADLARKQDVVRLVVENRTPPVPGWFLGYLGEAVPPELVVTNLHVKRGSNLWQFQMAGQLQPAGKPNTSNTLAAAVAELSTRLANGPFHCLVFRSVATNPVAATSAKSPALATWAARLSSTAATETNMQTQFSLEGVMR